MSQRQDEEEHQEKDRAKAGQGMEKNHRKQGKLLTKKVANKKWHWCTIYPTSFTNG